MLSAVLAGLAIAAPAPAGVSSGERFSVTISYPTRVSYGDRATISGRVSSGGWKTTLFLRAAGEARYHPAGSSAPRADGRYSVRTGRLVRATRFRLVYTRGDEHVTGHSHLIGVQAQVTTADYSYAADGSLRFSVRVLPAQPAGARVRVRGTDAMTNAVRNVVTLGLTRSGAMSVASPAVADPAAYSNLEVQFLGSATSRPSSAFFTPPPP